MQRLGLQYSGGRTPAERHTSAVVQFYRGIALLWAGYPSDAEQALETAKKLGRDTPIQSQADNLLHPSFFHPTSGSGYPVFVPISTEPAARQGSLLQAQGHQISAERLYQRAREQNPKDVEALVAAAVGLFDEDNLVPAFSHLGPLAQRFPRSQVVRYYLGLLSAWTAQGPRGDQAVQADDGRSGRPRSLGKQADQFLAGLEREHQRAVRASDRASRRPVPLLDVPRRGTGNDEGAGVGEDDGTAVFDEEELEEIDDGPRTGDELDDEPAAEELDELEPEELRARDHDRLAAALPQGRRQGRPAHGGAGGRAREADRARRPPREAGDGRGEPAPRRLDREALPQPGAAVPRPDPGGHDRPRPRGGEVRPPPRLQVLDLRDVVDPAGGRPRARRQGPDDPDAGARGREAEQDPPRRAQAPRRATAASRRRRRSPRELELSRRGGRADPPHRRRRRSRSRSRSATTRSRSSATSSRTTPSRCPTRPPA